MTASVQPLVDYLRTEQTSFSRGRVRRLKFVIAGAGAIGNEVAKALGLLGCGEVVVIDHDTVDRHNLTRSVLFRTDDRVGCNKALSLVTACRHYFPDTVWTALETEVADAGSQWIAESDLVFSCVDNDLARLEIAWLCAKFNLPMVDAGLGGENYSKIRISLFPGRNAASFCCLLPPARRRELLMFWDCRPFSCSSEPSHQTAFPGTPTAAAIAGSFLTDLGLRHLLMPPSDAPSAQSVELVLDPPHLSTIHIPRSSQCPFHEDPLGRCVFEPADSSLTVRELLDRAGEKMNGEPVLVLDWPVCGLAKCRDCGAQWEPMTRLARFRRGARCPSCGSGSLAVLRLIHRIARESPLTENPLRSFLMPDHHFYTIEFSEDPGQ
jgi:molybdopterin-synthase adenylyltransferase